MNSTVRPPGPFGAALPRNKDLGRVGHSGWGQDGNRVRLVHSRHPQPVPFPQGCWAVGAQDGVVPSQRPCLV